MQYWFSLLIVFVFCSAVIVQSEGFTTSSSYYSYINLNNNSIQQRQHKQRLSYKNSPMATTTTTTTTTTISHNNNKIVVPTSTAMNVVSRGGGGGVVSSRSSSSSSKTALFVSKDGEAVSCPFTKTMTVFGSVWGSFGVIYILAKAIRRVLPIAMEPFAGGTLSFTPIQWSMYVLSCLFFAYAEGYKGFHLKFAPLVVKRSFTLVIGTPQGNNPLNYILSPMYSMGLFAATKKRLITSWSVTIGVAAIVAIVKKLPIVPRCILDAGVIVGLSLGSLSILYHFIKSIATGQLPNVDACLPSNIKTPNGEDSSKKSN
jgi:hypothetical protein